MSETEINKSEISNKSSSVKDQLGGEKNFDENRFNKDAEQAQKDGKSLDSLNIEDYRKKDDNNSSQNYSNNSGLYFSAGIEDGMHVARGPEGKVIKAQTQDELHTLLAQEFLKDAKERGVEPQAYLENPARNPETMKSFAKNFINAGIQIGGDLPNDPQFWQQLKQDYLKNPEHNTENWNKLTSKVPPEFMGEKTKTQEKSKLDHIKNLRNGTNTNLTPPADKKPIQRTNVNQTAMNKMIQNQGYE